MHPTCCRCQGGLRHHPERGTPPADEMTMSLTTTTVGRGSGCLVGHTGWQGLTQRAVCTRVQAARSCAIPSRNPLHVHCPTRGGPSIDGSSGGMILRVGYISHIC